jgi:hypothetical protein
MLWFFLLVLILSVAFGWQVATVLMVLWSIGYVGFWLFMLCKPVKRETLASYSDANANSDTSCSLRQFAQSFRW